MNTNASTVRFGIVGLGSMGSAQAGWLQEGRIPRAKLVAVADGAADLSQYSATMEIFTSSEAMIRSGKIDAVIISTPHYSHTSIGIDAFQNGLHVMVEKPISVHKADAERLIAAHTNPQQQFGVMFNMRTHPAFRRIKRLIDTRELGEIRRINWTVTDWFRTDAYYRSGGWRATWEGEGGGVLLNQCPHQLDLLQWLFGMPTKISAYCRFGRYHDIEVEDEVTAYLEYGNGASGVFITSTGEAPGTNRLEIAAERGRLIYEDGVIRWTRNEVPAGEHSRMAKGRFQRPDTWNVEIPVDGKGEQHVGILTNFVEAILDGACLIAPGFEGIYSVELANAMLMSTFLDRAITLPLDALAYEAMLNDKIDRR